MREWRSVELHENVTMADIARRSGVALSTVSYVLSGKRSVSKETQERVRKAIEDLDYRPHPRARALASGTSRTIALFLPSVSWSQLPVQQTFVAGVTQATSEHDYALLLSTAPSHPGAAAEIVHQRRADGVILMETLAEDPRVEELRAQGHPFQSDRPLRGQHRHQLCGPRLRLCDPARRRASLRAGPSSVSHCSTSPKSSWRPGTARRCAASPPSRR